MQDKTMSYIVTRPISTQLRRWRDKHGLNRIDAAAVLGRSPRVLENWEQGRSAPRGQARAALLQKLSERLDRRQK
jgi:DNA-binding transcriptional regulator YiaG